MSSAAAAASASATQAPTGAGAMHPYKRHFLKSQSYVFEDLKDTPSATNSNDDFLSAKHSPSPVLEASDPPAAKSPSPPSPQFQSYDNTKWLQTVGPPPRPTNTRQPSSLSLGSSDEIQGFISSPSDSSSQFHGSAGGTGAGGFHKNKSLSVDLSHLYMVNGSLDTQLTSTNESAADMSHQLVSRYLGPGSNASLVSRLKTIEMYRQNVKKSKDATVLFNYAQYMLQTALTMESSNTLVGSNSDGESMTQAQLKKKFLKEGQHYLKKLSAKGYSDAQYLLGDAYASGAFGKVENREAFTLFQAAAKHGHVESAYRTAHCFEEGLGTTRDARKALDFLKFSASRNHPSAMYKLGLYSFYGRMGLGTDVNTKQNGIKWLSRASARANDLTCAAPYELAKIYQKGFLDIVIPDEKYSMELYIQAASLGHVPSSTLLGQIYETGNEVVPQDTSLSIHYYTQAALRGDPVAMLALCAWYLLGAEPAFEKDENEAFQWALKAATAGYPKAQFTLGYFYEKGKGCEPNEAYALKWYEKAAQNKDNRAISKLKSMGQEDRLTVNKKKNHRKSRSINTIGLFKNLDSDNGSTYSMRNSSSPGLFTNSTSQRELSNSGESGFKVLSDPPTSTAGVGAHRNTQSVPSQPSSSQGKKSEINRFQTQPAALSLPKANNTPADNDKDRKKKDCIVM
ncbi:hypothetical protein ZYGR_0E01450 [Zygosaccharomyces rouxii]|uniref:ZYRO0B03212p n=2 Tax=Zygosaccharomyces rouxii TaxID=4956 RepID=C5DQV1_ZYGRC|nr:uncharacterized protein ZYRO0B03212g [Zygosaccharomyces rouxii]KAH9200289.1 hypothetical protein LQ764DRAFT_114315 [Zygosaccharomyces rouxii]GAV47130.1 hypothetical protein ZYGR_0E01450 [Zygosaccharomyces rouxii]CAR26162.1 ZYRO0B03212p [Zygosaccharomyces rouxii]